MSTYVDTTERGLWGMELGYWPLAGRDSELRLIGDVLAAPGTPGVVLVGDAGVGKTRLAREALHRAAATGRAHEWLVATRGMGSIPFGAVSHLLPPDLVHEANALTLITRVAEAFAVRAVRGPVIVGIDDAHLLDGASAGLLGQLTDRRLVVPLATVRADEPVPGAVRPLWKDAYRLPVRPLTPAAVDQLLDRALPGQVDPISRQRLRRLAAGNPLLLRELLADALDSGALARREGVWCWRGSVPGTARLGELVRARLETLDPDVRQVLEVVACAESLGLAALARVVEPGAMERAERGGLVLAEHSGNRVSMRLAHPLYGEAIRATLPASRVRVIASQLADALAASPLRRRDDALVVSVLQLQAGTIQHRETLLEGARQAAARFDYDLAERLARAARGAGCGPEADYLLAEILQYRARSQEAIEALPEAPPTDGDELATWAIARSNILYWGLDQIAEAEHTLSVVADRDEPQAVRSWIQLFDGRCETALRTAQEVLGRPGVPDRAVIWATLGGASAAGLLGRFDEAMAIGDRGRAAAAAQADVLPWAQAQVGYGICHALRAAGRLHQAREVTDEGYRAAVECDAISMTGMWAGLRGVVAKAQGRVGDAQAALREAVALLEGHDEYQCTRLCLAELAGTAALTGDTTAARDWLIRADAQRRACNRLFEPWIELDRAWVEAVDPSRVSAVGTALRAADLARETEQPAFEAIALYDVARLGAAARVLDRLDRVAAQLAGGVGPVLADAAHALAGTDGATLEKVGAALVEHGQILLAAELNAAAARAHRRSGLTLRMRAAVERVAALRVACQGARTPLLTMGREGSPLSHREREVAMLAVTLPSHEIANRLGLSIHTVNNTLSRVYAKLDVRGRRELAAVLGTEGEAGA